MRIAFRAALLGTLVLLSACGGGGGGGDASTPPPTGTTLTGVVAVGAPLAGATVESWCADGQAGPTATTNAGGVYEMQLTRLCAAPWLLQATATDPAIPRLFSFGDVPAGPMDPGAVTVLNITSLTSLFVELSTGSSDRQQVLDTLRATSRSNLEATWQDILQRVNDLRPSTMAPVTVEGIFAKTFQPRLGDPMDDLLERLNSQRGAVATAALMEQFEKKGGDLAGANPWKTLFTGSAPLVLSGTNCTASSGPVADVTATLRMDGPNLRVEAASAAFGGTQVLTAGPGTRSDFSLEVRGDSPFASIAVYESGGGNFSVQNVGGVPTLNMAGSGGGFVNCTLANPIRRDALVAFHPAARVLSAVPKTGASGSCSGFNYAVTALGDVHMDGSSLPDDWLDASHARYYENLQFLVFGSSTPAYQVELVARAGGAGIQPYFFSPSYGLNCMP